MALGNLSQALTLAQNWTWDQTHGYTFGGMGYASDDYGFDCSGFVGRALHDSGFNYPSYHVGTRDMDNNPMSRYNTLGSAGFNLIPVNDLNNIPPLQHGDIIVMNSYDGSWSGAGGHTFFYAENINAYTDPSADYDTTAIVNHAKIEASADRGHTAPGDHRKNGTGAYWEVWTHAYNTLIPVKYDPQSTTYHNYVTIARLPYNENSIGAIGAILALLPHKRNKRRL